MQALKGEEIKVYVKVDDKSHIVAIDSSVFINDLKAASWQQIDKGTGERFAHAQVSYLPKGIKDEYGIYNYQYINGAIVEATDKSQEREKIIIRGKIEALKLKLAQLDYIGVKIATGRATREEYAEEIKQMQAWVDEIHKLEKDL